MMTELLATKLRIPPPTQHVVRRTRLVDALDAAIPRHKLTLISAPAGYGKTTLLADWARASRLPVAWLTLGEEDNDLARFFRYLFTAWERIEPGVADSALGVLLGAMEPEPDAVLTAFVNLASELDDPTVFVLDDYQVIEQAAIHVALTFLLDHLPPSTHVVLACRDEPPLPLARYRARQELVELDAGDLRFSVAETDLFLNRQLGLDLADDTIASLHAQLEGWIAGTQMAALTLRRHDQPPEDLIVSGRHRFIADYLSQDVLAHLPGEQRRFLLQTSILDRLSGPLADAVSGGSDGQTMLETLERENLFLVPLDDNREWYRYHRLFADFLREELRRQDPDEIRDLHRKAARWYFAHDLAEQAFQHALASQDADLVFEVLDRYVLIKLHGGDLKGLETWLDAIPAAWYDEHPQFGLARATLLAGFGAFEACLQSIKEVEALLTPIDTQEARWQMGRVMAFHCFVACVQNDLDRAERLAEDARQTLRDDDVGFRASIFHALGDTYSRNGRWQEAHAAYLGVLAHGRHYAARMQAAHVYGALADLELRQGHLQVAAGYWRKALAAINEPSNWGRLPLPVIGWVYIRMGELLYEWNQPLDAWEHVMRGLERAEAGGDVRSMLAGYLLAGRIRLTAGDTETAANYLELARPLVEDAPIPEWTSRFERLQLELWLAQDRLRAAVDWSDAMLAGDTLRDRPEPEVARLTVARALIVKGDSRSVDMALALLAPLIRTAEAAGRTGIRIEALALQALATWQRGDRPGALTLIEHALRLA
ncbi:MAG TPA: AAA family ATPase, partial [Thermomicrobiales bacterium]|nr:AAA family ATPase [Thermomicrobiales bacterium]